MTYIPSFKQSLLTNPQVEMSPELAQDIISRPQLNQAPDTFESSASDAEYEKRGGMGWGSALGIAVGIGGLFLAARKGFLGSWLKKITGGGEKVLSEAKLGEKIKSALAPLEESGNAFGEIKILGKNARVERITPEGFREIVVFDRAAGEPQRRIVFMKYGNGVHGALEYKVYSKEDILAAGLADNGTPYKHLVRTAKNPLAGRKSTKTVITYNNEATSPVVIDRQFCFPSGKLRKVVKTENGLTIAQKFDHKKGIVTIKDMSTGAESTRPMYALPEV